MAHRHLMAVCVVCLLCAEHLPCEEHVSLPSQNINSISQSQRGFSPSSSDPGAFTVVSHAPSYHYDKRKDKAKFRQKRHADHHHHEATEHHHHTETPEVTKDYIQKIFATYSSNETMNVNDFERMMDQLNLTNLLPSKVQTEETSKCMNGLKFLGKMTETKEDEEEHHEHEDHDHDDHSHDHNQETTTKLSFRDRIKIDKDHMLAMCPILLYHVVNGDRGCLDDRNFNESELFVKPSDETEPKDKVWLYSTLAIIVVSLCGLFGVAVIPIMEKHFYHHVLQFLVALAVGTLAGDALLHLLPHAMMPAADEEDVHKMMMLRGLAAVGGIVFFYFFERFLTMVTEWRQRRQKQVNPSSRTRVQRDPESVSLNNGIMTCKHKYSDYPYCYDEIAKATHDDHHEHQHVEGLQLNNIDKIKLNEDHIILSPVEGKKMNGIISDHHIEPDNNTLSTSLDDGSIESNTLCNNNKQIAVMDKQKKKDSVPDERYKIILREHQRTHHGHSHTHGHVHSPPRSLSAVVWMVIMGDGLHNFTDGMAIGAAFSNNIAGGFSTAFAVFCHELPHELGDFAVLLKAGMSAKQAVYYNILSSVLSFFGMCFGIWIGDTPAASQWIFAVAAGLFIYIALVDMMPELTSSHGKEESCMLTQCLLQFLGMTCGFSTMLLIAIYEHDLKEIFASS